MAAKKNPVLPFPHDPSGLLPYHIGMPLWGGMYEAPPQWFQDIPHEGVETPYRKSVIVTERDGDTRILTWKGLNRADDTNNAFLNVEWKPGGKGAVVYIALAQARLVLRRNKDWRNDPATIAVEQVMRADRGFAEKNSQSTAAASVWLLNAMIHRLTTKGGSCAALGADLDRRRERLEGLFSGEDLRTANDKSKGWTEVEKNLLNVIWEAIQSMMAPERKPPHTRQEVTDRYNDRFGAEMGTFWESKDTGKVLKRLGLDWI